MQNVLCWSGILSCVLLSFKQAYDLAAQTGNSVTSKS